MQRLLLLGSMAILLPLQSLAQGVVRESIGSMATSYTSGKVDIQSCVGQAYNPGTAGENGHRPGFIQPELKITTFSELFTVKLYPNPTASFVNFSIDAQLQDVEVVVMDLMGNRVFDQHYFSVSSGQIPLSGFADGMYLIHLRQGNETIATGKIIKVH